MPTNNLWKSGPTDAAMSTRTLENRARISSVGWSGRPSPRNASSAREGALNGIQVFICNAEIEIYANRTETTLGD